MMDFYGYQRPLGKIQDIPELRSAFIAVYDARSKADAVRFGLSYGRHLLGITQTVPCAEVIGAFDAMQRWLDGKANYHEARNISFSYLSRFAREEKDPIRDRFYRTMAQIACIPHVKFHALWASDFAITLINRMYPDSLGEVRREREVQIALLEQLG